MKLCDIPDTATLRKLLQSEPFFWSRLGFCYDPPRADANGQQIVFSREYDDYNRIHRNFADIGVKFHTTILHSGWVGVDRYDYRLTDEILEALFKNNPDIYYMPRVKLNVPPEWCRENPKDTFVYYHGPRTEGEISALAETLQHDYFGYEGEGYFVNGGKVVWKDDRPNYDGLIGLQSFSSKKWIADASEALRRLLQHLAQSPYADRIIGVHVAYGMCGETHPHGLWGEIKDGRRGDFGIQAQEDFANWGIRKYGSISARDAVWGTPSPPDPWERESPVDCLAEMFYPENSKVHDYFTFLTETNVAAITAFCKLVKDSEPLFGHKLAAGAFYGYLYYAWAANAGHLGFDQVLNSPYVDFLSSPKGYYRNMAGDPGGEQGPSESVARKCVWLDEIDNLTYLDRRRDAKNRPKDAFETKTMLWREAIKNLSHGQGFWWMDLGEGWYDSPELMQEIAAITDLQRTIEPCEKTVAEVLLVIDEDSVGYTRINQGLNHLTMFELHSELKLIGAPVDTLRLKDLWDADLSSYKMVVFANAFRLATAEREALLKKLEGKLLVWNHAAGILAPEYDPDNFSALTGFLLSPLSRANLSWWDAFAKEHGDLVGDFPLFTLEKGTCETLLTYPDGTPNCVLNGNTCVCCTPVLTRTEFRTLAKRAGVTIWCDADCTVYADQRIAGYFPKENFSGSLRLPSGEWQSTTIPAKGLAVYYHSRQIR